MGVSEVLIDYLANITHLTPESQRMYRQHLTVFAGWCTAEQVSLEQVNNKNVQRFLEWLKAKRKPHKNGRTELSSRSLAGYVRNIWTLLYWCLNDDEHQQYVKLQTVKAIKMPRTGQFVKEVFTDEEIEALFNACKHDSKPYEYQLRDTLILALLIETGVRSQEIRTLTIDNVIFARGVNEDSYIKVIGKGQKEREIPIGNHARRTLQRYLLAGCYDFLCLVSHVQCERRQPFTQLASVLAEAADDSGMLPVDCYLRAILSANACLQNRQALESRTR